MEHNKILLTIIIFSSFYTRIRYMMNSSAFDESNCNLFVLAAVCMKRHPGTDQKMVRLAFENKLKAAPSRKGGSKYKGN